MRAYNRGALLRLGQQASAVIGDELGDGGGAGGGRVDHALDDGAADDGAVGNVGQCGKMVRLGDAKADADGAVGHGSKLAEVFGEIGRQLVAGAGDSGDGEIIDEPGTKAGDFTASLGHGGGRDEKNGVEAGGADLPADIVGLGGREIGNNQSGKPGRPCIGEKSVGAISEYDAVAQHRQQGRGNLLSCVSNHCKDVGYFHVVGQGGGEGLLDCRPIGDGIGKREADLDGGGRDGVEGTERGGGGGKIGKPRGQKRHQADSAAAMIGEGLSDGSRYLGHWH